MPIDWTDKYLKVSDIVKDFDDRILALESKYENLLKSMTGNIGESSVSLNPLGQNIEYIGIDDDRLV